MKRSNSLREIIAPGETWGKGIGYLPTPKGLNMKRSNSLREIIAPGETWGKGIGYVPTPKGLNMNSH
jgi:hypothetical protein